MNKKSKAKSNYKNSSNGKKSEAMEEVKTPLVSDEQ